MISPLIKAEDLQKLPPNRFILVEAGSGQAAAEHFTLKHLKGALYADLERDLSEIPENAANGGRHPLPSPGKFSAVLQNLGIEKNSHVVVYDNKNAANAAARFWWMLKAAGVENVQVLDGGFQAAERAGFQITDEIQVPEPSEKFYFEQWLLPTVTLSQVEKNSVSKDFTLIDVRDAYRYNGESEPIDPVAGHIPGTINIPFQNNLRPDGTFKSPEELKKLYQPVFTAKPSGHVAVHCGSGVTACHTLLAMAYAGFSLPQLYVGSWSEWCRNNKTIATEL